MPGGRTKIIADRQTDLRNEIEAKKGRDWDLRLELQKARDNSTIERLEAEIAENALQIRVLTSRNEVLSELAELSGDSEAIGKAITEIRRESIETREALKLVASGLAESIHEAIKDTNIKVERTQKILEEYIESYQKDSETNFNMSGLGLILSIVGFLVGLAGLGLAIPGVLPKDKPKATPSPLRSAGLPAGGGARPGESLDAPKLSDEEVEKMMQDLVVNKALIASGKVPQDGMWKNLAAVADTTDLEGQDWTLIFIQEAALHLPGREEFFWLDPSEATARYEALHAAYKKSKKLSDVYLAATQIRYDGKEVPTFHVALLIQWALKLVKHDQLFPSADGLAPA